MSISLQPTVALVTVRSRGTGARDGAGADVAAGACIELTYASARGAAAALAGDVVAFVAGDVVAREFAFATSTSERTS